MRNKRTLVWLLSSLLLICFTVPIFSFQRAEAYEITDGDLTTSGYEIPGEFGAPIGAKTEISSGALAGKKYENYLFGFALFDERNNVVFVRGGENARLDGGALTTDKVDTDEMIGSHKVYFKNQLEKKYTNYAALEAAFKLYLKDRMTDGSGVVTFNPGIAQNNNPYAFSMTGLRFRYGGSKTSNFSNYSVGDYNIMSINNAFVAVVPNALDHNTTETGYSFYTLRGEYYEEYIRQFAASKAFGTVVSEDSQIIEIDGIEYTGQLFSGGYMYKKDGRLIADNTKVYDPVTKTFSKGSIENYLMPPGWFSSEAYSEMIKVSDSLYYFNYRDCVAEAKILANGEYSYKYYSRRLYDRETGKMNIVRYKFDEICNMAVDPALWNGETSLSLIKGYYPEMDQSVTAAQFETDVKDAMWEAYLKYCVDGISLGKISGENIMLWGNVIKIGFLGSAFDEKYIDGNEKAFLLYNPVMKKSFAFYGPPIAACHGLNNTNGIDRITQMGAPVDEIQVITEGIYADSWYQNFTTGYIFVEKAFVDMVTFVEGGSYHGETPIDTEKNEEALKQKEEREKMFAGRGCNSRQSAGIGFSATALLFCSLILTRKGR